MLCHTNGDHYHRLVDEIYRFPVSIIDKCTINGAGTLKFSCDNNLLPAYLAGIAFHIDQTVHQWQEPSFQQKFKTLLDKKPIIQYVFPVNDTTHKRNNRMMSTDWSKFCSQYFNRSPRVMFLFLGVEICATANCGTIVSGWMYKFQADTGARQSAINYAMMVKMFHQRCSLFSWYFTPWCEIYQQCLNTV